jgi:hypothetical protein
MGGAYTVLRAAATQAGVAVTAGGNGAGDDALAFMEPCTCAPSFSITPTGS